MTPVEFPEVNAVYAKDQSEYNPLPVLKKPDGTVISCWELTEDEIQTLLQTKRIYLAVMTFNQPLQPVLITTDKTQIIE